ncbi:MAG: hypothetical protein J0I12_02150 [Candidatus Eremiobacteraeota bacterium]|nr:hypothetical protein [Candidatus Eremiobacteraeota bacterium]
MKKNLLVLVLVVVVCAVGAQWLRQGGQGQDPQWTALRLDMIDGLERLWNTRGHQVELLPSEGGVQASVQVVLPENTSPRQQQWNYPFLRYVSERHREPMLRGLTLVGLPETRVQESSPQPYATGGSIEARVELMRRRAQGWLDNTVGEGNGLALLDGEVKEVPQPIVPGGENRYVMPRDRLEKRVRIPQGEQARGPIVRTEYSLVLVLVINGRAEGAEAKMTALPQLEAMMGLDLGRRDSRRVVVLP